MVPQRLLRRPDAGQMCAHCAALFAVLDEEQGDRGRPWRGRNKLVRALGWSRETVTEHVRHLEAQDLLSVEQQGRTMAVYRVANPSRQTAPVDGTPPTPERGPVDGKPPTGGRYAAHPDADSGRHAAHRSRSPRSGSGLAPGVEHQNGGTSAVCAEASCDAPADGQPDPDGTPWCRAHESF